MSPAFPTRRRADEFDALLAGTVTEAPSAELAALLAVVDRVRAVPEVAPRPEFAASLRERLMAEAPSALAEPAVDEPATRPTVARRTPSTTPRRHRARAAIAALSIVGATTASAFASQGALPGDTLYPVKRLIEDARTSLAMGERAKADALLAQARTRLQETRELGTRDDSDTDAITHSLQSFADAADHASTVVLADYADHGNEKEIARLRTFTQQGITDLSELTELLPASVDDALADAVNTLIAIDHSAAEACSACGDAGITELPSNLVDLLSATTSDANDQTSSVAAETTGKTDGKPQKEPSQAPSASATGQLTDDLNNTTGQLTGTGGPSGPSGTGSTSPSSTPTSVGGVVSGAGDAVGGTVGSAGDAVGDAGTQVGGPVGGVLGTVGGVVGSTSSTSGTSSPSSTGDLGDTVTGTTDAVGGTVDGVTGGLLGGATQSPTP